MKEQSFLDNEFHLIERKIIELVLQRDGVPENLIKEYVPVMDVIWHSGHSVGSYIFMGRTKKEEFIGRIRNILWEHIGHDDVEVYNNIGDVVNAISMRDYRYLYLKLGDSFLIGDVESVKYTVEVNKEINSIAIDIRDREGYNPNIVADVVTTRVPMETSEEQPEPKEIDTRRYDWFPLVEKHIIDLRLRLEDVPKSRRAGLVDKLTLHFNDEKVTTSHLLVTNTDREKWLESIELHYKKLFNPLDTKELLSRISLNEGAGYIGFEGGEVIRLHCSIITTPNMADFFNLTCNSKEVCSLRVDTDVANSASVTIEPNINNNEALLEDDSGDIYLVDFDKVTMDKLVFSNMSNVVVSYFMN